MHSERTTAIPLEVIWEYGSLKVDLCWSMNLPKGVSINMYDVFEITQFIDENGLDPIEFTILGERGLITDGNHRLMAARKLGYNWVPVKFKVIMDHTNSPLFNHPEFKELDQPVIDLIKELFLIPHPKVKAF